MRQLGNQIKELREQKGWTRVQLGVYAGVSTATVSLAERGLRTPNADTLVKLARALEVEPGLLLAEAEAPKVSAPPEPSDEERRDRGIRELLMRGHAWDNELGLPHTEFEELVASVPQLDAGELVELAVRTKDAYGAALAFVQGEIDAGIPVLEKLALQRKQAGIVERRTILISAIITELEQRKDSKNQQKVEALEPVA